MTRADLVEQREMYVSIFDRLAKLFSPVWSPKTCLRRRRPASSTTVSGTPNFS